MKVSRLRFKREFSTTERRNLSSKSDAPAAMKRKVKALGDEVLHNVRETLFKRKSAKRYFESVITP